ncbi:MAG: hypothetical protein ACR2MC_03415 [Actinomycetota bacterium]
MIDPPCTARHQDSIEHYADFALYEFCFFGFQVIDLRPPGPAPPDRGIGSHKEGTVRSLDAQRETRLPLDPDLAEGVEAKSLHTLASRADGVFNLVAVFIAWPRDNQDRYVLQGRTLHSSIKSDRGDFSYCIFPLSSCWPWIPRLKNGIFPGCSFRPRASDFQD